MSVDDRLRGAESRLLADLDEDARNAAFDRLQARLPGVWRSMRLNEPGESVVVVPSVSLDRVNARFGAVNQAMEERYLFLLLAGLGLGGLVTVLMISLSDTKQRLGDRVAGTIVVKTG